MKKILLIISILSVNLCFAQVKTANITTAQPMQYQRVDITIELIAKWANPYLQEDVALDMLITSPSGKSLVLPCYYVSGASAKLSQWAARFTPQEAGKYQYSFRLTKGKKITTSKPQEFVSAASAKQGFLHTKNSWVLQFDNGMPFRGVGENICWESRDNDDSKFFKELHERADIYNYDNMLPDLASNGGNFFRT